MNRYAVPDMDLRLVLAERGLECHLLVQTECTPQNQGGQISQDFPSLMCAEIEDLVFSAYDRRVTPDHVRYHTWAVTLRNIAPPHTVVGCSTLWFTCDLPSYFHTAFEAIHPDLHRSGLGRILYDCVTVWTRFLILNDVLVLDGIIRSGGEYCLVSTIDRDGADDPQDDTDDNGEGHGAFLKKLGFVRALHDFRQDTETEIAFQIAFSVPVVSDLEQEGNPQGPGESQPTIAVNITSKPALAPDADGSP